jgi:hypothetical protein
MAWIASKQSSVCGDTELARGHEQSGAGRNQQTVVVMAERPTDGGRIEGFGHGKSRYWYSDLLTEIAMKFHVLSELVHGSV